MCSAIVEHPSRDGHGAIRRPRTRRTGLLVLLAGLAQPQAAWAEELDADARAARMIEHAKQYYGTSPPRSSCGGPTAETDEIVVCGYRRLEARYAPLAPPEIRDIKMVALGAPPVGGGAGVGVTMRGCFLQKCPKQLYFIDVKAIPEPPPGSDADLIAKGLMPAR
jgi:hypothetical protein